MSIRTGYDEAQTADELAGAQALASLDGPTTRAAALQAMQTSPTAVREFVNTGWTCTDLLDADGDRVRVTGVTGRAEVNGAYNLTVSGFHTYYVLAEQTPVLVHNCGELDAHEGVQIPGLKRIDKFLRENPEGGSQVSLTLRGSFGTESLGRVSDKTKKLFTTSNTYEIWIRRVPGHPRGFVVETAFPTGKRKPA